MHNTNLERATLALVGLILGLGAAGCGSQESAANSPTAMPLKVEVSVPVEREVIDYEELTGRLDAVESVEIRGRVTGFLKKVAFEPGAEVDAGAPLFEIDPREYQAQLDAAKAAQASSDAFLAKATADFNRTKGLKDKGVATAEDYDRDLALKQEAEAAVLTAQAKKERAQLDVDFTKISAPIAGRISRPLVTQGNLVTANVTLLTNIVSVDPIHGYFNLDEVTLLGILRMIREGKVKSKDEREVPVELGLMDEEGYPHKGTVDFVDNRVDPGTGTMQVRGKFANPKNERNARPLVPGLFARVRIPLSEPHSAVLISERAIGRDQGQAFVYVVNDQNEAVFRRVSLGEREQGMRIVSEGLQAGEKIVTNGLQRVRAGAKLDPKVVDMPSAGEKRVRAKEG